jgi:hypothetical protein
LEQSSIERAHWRLLRMLLRRIAVAGGLIAAILASATYFAGLRDMRHAVVTLAADLAV